MVNFSSIQVKYSVWHFVTLISIYVVLTALLLSTNCVLIFKFGLLVLFTFLVVYSIYNINQHTNNSKIDILFDINNVIITKDSHTNIYEITNWLNIGSWCVVIKLTNKRQQFNLIIPKYSCDLITYKNLLRNAIWNQPKPV